MDGIRKPQQPPRPTHKHAQGPGAPKHVRTGSHVDKAANGDPAERKNDVSAPLDGVDHAHHARRSFLEFLGFSGSKHKPAATRGAQVGLQLAHDPATSHTLKKAVVGALLGLTLLMGAAPQAFAQSVDTASVATSQVMLPQTTGPPASTVAPWQTRLGDVVNTDTTQLSPATQKALDAAVASYTATLNSVMHLDVSARDLAFGVRPFQPGDTLTVAQQDQLTGATKDLLLQMPLGAFSPQLASSLQDLAQQHGIAPGDLASTPLNKLGDAGGKIALQLADQLKSAHPGVYWGTVATAAVAAGTMSYLQGTAPLEKLGIKPEFKTGLFHDQLTMQVGGTWGARLTNVNLTSKVQGNFKVGDGKLTTDVDVALFGPRINAIDIRSAHLGVGFAQRAWSTSASIGLGQHGAVQDGQVKAAYTGTAFSLSSTANLGVNAQFKGANVVATYKAADFNLSSTANLGEGGAFHDATVDASYAHKGVTLSSTTAIDAQGKLAREDLKAGYAKDGFAVSTSATLDGNASLTAAHVQGSYAKAGWTTTASTDLNGKGDVTKAAGSIGYTQAASSTAPAVSASVNASYDEHTGGTVGGTVRYVDARRHLDATAQVQDELRTGKVTGTMWLGYQPKPNIDLGIQGTLNNQGQSSVGVGLKIKF